MTTTTGLTVTFTPHDKGTPPGKLADAELHFSDAPLEGLKLIGFAIWERRAGAGRHVTFPARQYASMASGDRSRCCARSRRRSHTIASATSFSTRGPHRRPGWPECSAGGALVCGRSVPAPLAASWFVAAALLLSW